MCTCSRKSSSGTHWQGVRRAARPLRWAWDRETHVLWSPESSFSTACPYTLSWLSGAARLFWGSSSRADTTSVRLDASMNSCRDSSARTQRDCFLGQLLKTKRDFSKTKLHCIMLTLFLSTRRKPCVYMDTQKTHYKCQNGHYTNTHWISHPIMQHAQLDTSFLVSWMN